MGGGQEWIQMRYWIYFIRSLMFNSELRSASKKCEQTFSLCKAYCDIDIL